MTEYHLPSNAAVAQTSDYARRLPSRLTEMEMLWDLARGGDDAALHTLHKQTHQLRGSAGMYGFSQLGEAARALDIALSSFRSDSAPLTEDWTERLDALMTAMTAKAQEPPTLTESVPPASHPAHRQEALILVADDDPAIRDMLSLYLEQEGFLVVTAANGTEAIACARKHKPDVMLLDLEMPEMNGTEVMRHLRNGTSTSHIPVVVLTSHDAIDIVLEALSLDICGYLTKPTEIGTVVSKVFDVLMSTA
ncbi:MAG: response regulator [Rhodothermales bacterium]